MEAIGKQLKGGVRRAESREAHTDLKGRRWITRRGIRIDRTACCWRIRRMIDPAAEFVFVDPQHYRHPPAPIRGAAEGKTRRDQEVRIGMVK